MIVTGSRAALLFLIFFCVQLMTCALKSSAKSSLQHPISGNADDVAVLLKSEDEAQKNLAPSFCNPLNLQYRFGLDGPSRREAADPIIIVFKSRYFLFASKSGGYWHSQDLVDWKFVEPDLPNINDYAPTALVMGDTVYLTASNSQAIYSTKDPLGGHWQKEANIGLYWDPNLFLDDNGKVYLSWGCGNADPIQIVELDPARGWAVVGKPEPSAFGNPGVHGWDVFRDWRAAMLSERPFIEGSFMNKIGNKYYLQYAAPGTETKEYGDGVFVASSPKGPWVRDPSSPVSYKPTGFITSAGHGGTFQDLQGKWWHVATGRVNVRHNMERRVVLFPAFWNSSEYPSYYRTQQSETRKPSLLVDTMFGDFPIRIDQTRPDWQLLSLNKMVTASSSWDDTSPPPKDAMSYWSQGPPSTNLLNHSIQFASDDDIRTWWSAATGNPGEWLAMDIGTVVTVHAVQINFADQSSTVKGRMNDAYRYFVEISMDGNSWNELPALDRRDNTRDAPHDYVELSGGLPLRHIRVTNVHTPGGARFSISDLRVFGYGVGDRPKKAPTGIQVHRGKDKRLAKVVWETTDDAQYYVVRVGLQGGPAFHSYKVLNGNTSLELSDLSTDETYTILVDAVNEAGLTQGTTEVIS